jgi:sterol desaturase/sphingolipid hydroxylase (fatty acid hydroxylase superfamily)
MTEMIFNALQPTAALFAFVSVAYVIFFGPLRHLLQRRLIQTRYDGPRLLLHDAGFTLLNLSIVITVTLSLLQWLFGNEFIKVLPSPSIATSVAQFVLYFLAFDLYFYTFHRLLHGFFYKYVHSIHHRSTRPTPLTSYAVHPFEGFVSFMFTLLLFLVIDMSVAAFIAMNAYSVIHSVVIHSGHDFFPRWWYRNKLSKFYVTPIFHDLHHSDLNGVNYGIYTTVWDRLFGTISSSLEDAFQQVAVRETPAGRQTQDEWARVRFRGCGSLPGDRCPGRRRYLPAPRTHNRAQVIDHHTQGQREPLQRV